MDFLFGELSAADLTVIALAFAIGGTVKGTVGMGLPMIAVPIISTVIDPRSAIATMILPIMGANFLQARVGGSLLETASAYRALLIPMFAGSTVGALLITSIPTAYAAIILGTLVSLFALSTLAGWKPEIPSGVDRRLRPAIGLVSGLVGGMSSFFAPTVVPYLFSLRLDKTAFVRTMGVIFLVGEAPLFLGLAFSGFAPPSVWALSAAGWGVVGCAMAIGKRLRDRIPQERFMTMVGAMLLLVGLNMIRRVVF
ncbi:MAG: sulfite exporter TauE/SafE family protein [Rhodospirillaceae bacterium]